MSKSLGQQYVRTVRCVSETRLGMMAVRTYEPIICQECGYRVLSHLMPSRCPNEANHTA